MDFLAGYQTLLSISQQMLELARQQNWEALAAAESRRSALLATLPQQLPAMPAATGSAITRIIHQIQDCDREILDYVTPWREQTANLLARLNQGR